MENHLIAAEEPGLFRGIISQSVYRHPLATPEQKKVGPKFSSRTHLDPDVPRQEQFQEFARRAGCDHGGTLAQLACLRKASITAIAPAQDASGSYDTPYIQWTPVVDGTFIPDVPSTLILQGKVKRVPVLVG